MSVVVSRFGYTTRRKELVRGLVSFRNALRSASVRGFQWLDGSFVDHHPTREPNDIDVVTFVEIPTKKALDAFNSQLATLPDLFQPERARERYGCHAFGVTMTPPADELVGLVAYWHGLFSHSRAGAWRGILQVPLTDDDADDNDALLLLGGGTR